MQTNFFKLLELSTHLAQPRILPPFFFIEKIHRECKVQHENENKYLSIPNKNIDEKGF